MYKDKALEVFPQAFATPINIWGINYIRIYSSDARSATVLATEDNEEEAWTAAWDHINDPDYRFGEMIKDGYSN
jgi:hypothetical protein